jgi:hypothetical protein
MSQETKFVLQSAAIEIRELRRRCELLQAKVDGFELAGRFLTATLPGSNMGYSEDIAWKCDKVAESIGATPTSLSEQP